MSNNKYKILLVEDDEKISLLVGAMLEAGGYQVLSAGTCGDAMLVFASHLPDLVILDLGLPDRDGTEFLSYVRKNFSTPIIVLSARTDETDKVSALDAGANDYVTKPFGSAELMARVRSALRSSRHNEEGKLPGGRFHQGELTIDYDARRVFMRKQEIRLTQTEYNIVALLSQHCGKVMTYSSIMKEIWGYADQSGVKKLQVNMANIRRKLGEKPGESNCISNELGVGYRMNSFDD